MAEHIAMAPRLAMKRPAATKTVKKVMKSMKGMKAMKAESKQASTLEGDLWAAWLAHLLKHSSTWLWVLTVICHMFCLRVTEGLKLRASDFNWKTRSVRVAPLKRAPEVHKKIMPAYLPLLRLLRKEGKTVKRMKCWGVLGSRRVDDAWEWPEGQGRLFPSRCGGEGHASKDSVCHAIVKARKSFVPPAGCSLPDTSLVRSHSARHRKINDMKSSGATPDEGMTFARIKHRKTYDRYGKMTQTQAGAALQKNKKLQTTLKALYA